MKKQRLLFSMILLLIMFFSINCVTNSVSAAVIEIPNLEGEGTSSSPFLIQTEIQLLKIIETSNDGNMIKNKYANEAFYKLGNDITITNTVSYAPWGNYTNKFSGNVDGNNHLISGIKVQNEEFSLTGVFGCLNGATISNLIISNYEQSVSNSTYGWAGIVCGEAYSTSFNNVIVKNSSISGTRSVGSFVGYGEELDFNNCKLMDSTVNIGASNINDGQGYIGNWSGGYCGEVFGTIFNNCEISNCTVNNLSTGTSSQNGILAGRFSGPCEINNLSIVNSIYNAVNAVDYVGVVVGVAASDLEINNSTFINNQVNDIAGSCIGSIAGEIADSFGTINNVYSSGTIDGHDYLGGFYGSSSSATLIFKNCLSNINLKSNYSSHESGGFIGDNDYSNINFYNSINLCIQKGSSNYLYSFVEGTSGSDYFLDSNCYDYGVKYSNEDEILVNISDNVILNSLDKIQVKEESARSKYYVLDGRLENNHQFTFNNITNATYYIDGQKYSFETNVITSDAINPGKHFIVIVSEEPTKLRSVMVLEVFKTSYHTLSIASNNVKHGTVEWDNNDLDFNNLPYGTAINIMSHPESGYSFVCYKDKLTGTILSEKADFTLIVTENLEIIAEFAAMDSTIDISSGEYKLDVIPVYPWKLGIDANDKLYLTSTNNFKNSTESVFTYTAIVDGWFSFDWMVSSWNEVDHLIGGKPTPGSDYLIYYVNNTEGRRICGNQGWESETIYLKVGDVLKISYLKDEQNHDLKDAGFIKNIGIVKDSSRTLAIESNKDEQTNLYMGNILYGDIEYSTHLVSCNVGEIISLKAIANKGYNFVKWVNSKNETISFSETIDYEIRNNETLTAVFSYTFDDIFPELIVNNSVTDIIKGIYPFEIKKPLGEAPYIVSTNKGIDNSRSKLEIIIPGGMGGYYRFKYYISSEKSWDYLKISTEKAEIFNSKNALQNQIIESEPILLNDGEIITIEYIKDGSGHNGEDIAKIYSFERDYSEHTLNVTLSDSKGGEITSDTEYNTLKPVGTTYNLLATPFENYQFGGWYIADKLISKELSIEYVLTKDVEIIAVFIKITHIFTEADLLKIGQDYLLNGIFILQNNLTLTNLFTPIGNKNSPFTGTFDGNGYTISNLCIEGSTNCGLFGVTNGATIKNLTIKKASIVGQSQIGGFVGNAISSTIIDNCHFDGVLTGSQSLIGGFVGKADTTNACIVSNSTVSKNTIISGYNNVGGLSGAGGTFKNCDSFAEISGVYLVGGLIGGYNVNSIFNNCYFGGTSKINGSHGNNYPYWGLINGYGAWARYDLTNTGQLIDITYRSTQAVKSINVFNADKTLSSDISFDRNLNKVLIKAKFGITYASGSLLSETLPNGVTGNYGGVMIMFTMEDGTIKYLSTLDKKEGAFKSVFDINLDELTSYVDNFANIEVSDELGVSRRITSLFNNQEVSIWGSALIDNANDFEHLSFRVSGGIPTTFKDGKYYNERSIATLSVDLMEDLDLTSSRSFQGNLLNSYNGKIINNFEGFGKSEMHPYRGMINGNNHQLNVEMDYQNSYLVGIINISSEMDFTVGIKNLTVTGKIIGKYKVGIVGMFDKYYRYSTFILENVINKASIDCVGQGGLLGYANYSKQSKIISVIFKNVQNYGSVISRGGNNVGTIFGDGMTNSGVHIELDNVINFGTLYATGGNQIGGLVGQVRGVITHGIVENHGNVVAKKSNNVGGLIGKISDGSTNDQLVIDADTIKIGNYGYILGNGFVGGCIGNLNISTLSNINGTLIMQSYGDIHAMNNQLGGLFYASNLIKYDNLFNKLLDFSNKYPNLVGE